MVFHGLGFLAAVFKWPMVGVMLVVLVLNRKKPVRSLGLRTGDQKKFN